MSKKYKDIVIVEDQIFYQKVLETALKDHVPIGTRIRKINSGNSAVELLKKESSNIGVILLDMKMDDGDGITVLNFLQDYALYNIPVYIVSSLDSEFIHFIMQAVSEREIRLVGFVPKEAPFHVSERIKDLSQNIYGFITEERIATQPFSQGFMLSNENRNILDIIKSDLILYIRPKINLEYDYISGFEVISKLCDEKLGVLDEDSFIDFLDTSEKRIAFNWLVIERSFKYKSSIESMGFYSPFSITIDFELLEQSEFMDKLLMLKAKYNVDLSMFTFECINNYKTDSAILRLNIARLRMMEVTITISEYKADTNIDLMFCNEVKIDKELTSQILHSEKAVDEIESIFSLAKNKGWNIVVDGVDNKNVNDLLLSKSGVKEAQGHFYCMPRPIADIELIFENSFNDRISSVFGDVSSDDCQKMYDVFYENAKDVIESYLAKNKHNNNDRAYFIHTINGVFKVAGFYEAIHLIERYKHTKEIIYIYKLNSFLDYFIHMIKSENN